MNNTTSRHSEDSVGVPIPVTLDLQSVPGWIEVISNPASDNSQDVAHIRYEIGTDSPLAVPFRVNYESAVRFM